MCFLLLNVVMSRKVSDKRNHHISMLSHRWCVKLLASNEVPCLSFVLIKKTKIVLTLKFLKKPCQTMDYFSFEQSPIVCGRENTNNAQSTKWHMWNARISCLNKKRSNTALPSAGRHSGMHMIIIIINIVTQNWYSVKYACLFSAF